MKRIKDIFLMLAKWRTLLIAYFFVFLIPFLVLSGFVQRYILQTLATQSVNRSATTVAACMSEMDDMRKLMQLGAGQCKYDTNLQAAYRPDQLTAILALKEKLLVFKSQSPLFEEVWYYASGDEYLYSSSTSHSLEYFVHQRYMFEAESRVMELLDSEMEAGVYSATDRYTQRDVFLFFLPFQKIATNGQKLSVVRHTIVYAVRSDAVYETLEALILPDGQVRLCFGSDLAVTLSARDGRLIYMPDITISARGATVLSSSNIDVYAGEMTRGTDMYSAFRTVSAQSGWYMDVALRDDYISSVRLQWIWNIALVCLLSFGLVMTLVATKLIQRPIQNLKQKMAEQVGELATRHRFAEDDYEEIESFMTALSSENAWLKHNMAAHRTAAQNFLIFCLFRGKIESLKAFNQFGQRFSLHMDYPCFDVLSIILNPSDEEPSIRLEPVKDIVNSQFEQNALVLFQRITPSRKLEVVLCYDPKQYAWFHQSLCMVSAQLETEIPEGFVIGLGSNCETTSAIPLALMQSTVACNERLFDVSGAICEYDPDRMVRLTDAKLDILENALRSNNYVHIAQALEQIAARVSAAEALLTAQMLAQEALYLLSWWMEKAQAYEPLCASMSELLLAPYAATDELAQMINRLQDEFLRRASLVSVVADTDPVNRFCLYVERNFDSPDFSAQQMAHEFSMPLSTLSKYFSEGTGEKLIDYVTRLRMEKAIRLLTETDMTVRKVGMSVGYYDVNSFIRRFKAYYGTTPNAYRVSAG